MSVYVYHENSEIVVKANEFIACTELKSSRQRNTAMCRSNRIRGSTNKSRNWGQFVDPEEEAGLVYKAPGV